MKYIFSLCIAFFVSLSFGQTNLTYQNPPEEILELADVDLAPITILDSKAENMVLLSRDQYKSIAEMSSISMIRSY